MKESDSSQPGRPAETATVRRHVLVMVALMACTLVMVAVSFLPFGSTPLKVSAVLAFAVVEAFLVAGHLMHLISEKRLVYSVLGLTAVFLVCVLFLPMLSEADQTSRFFR